VNAAQSMYFKNSFLSFLLNCPEIFLQNDPLTITLTCSLILALLSELRTAFLLLNKKKFEEE